MSGQSNQDNPLFFPNAFKATLEKSLYTLEGIIHGMSIDGHIGPKELEELNSWYNAYARLSNRSPFNELIPLIKNAIHDKVLTREEADCIMGFIRNQTAPDPHFDSISADIRRLHGFMQGILTDGHIGEQELRKLQSWLNENTHLKGFYPYDEVESIIVNILKDGRIDSQDQNYLKVFFSDFISWPVHTTIAQNGLDQLKQSIIIQGICSVSPHIELKNKSFSFTGIFTRAKRREIIQLIKTRGAIYSDTIHPKLNYLVAGARGNPCWSFSCHGWKVKEAVSYRKKGANIIIVNEYDFWKAIEE